MTDPQYPLVHKTDKLNKKNGLEIQTVLLGYLDSNQEKQDQNLLCYHYTIAQDFVFACKGTAFL